MKSSLLSSVLVFWNIILTILLIIFVFQRELYLFQSSPYLKNSAHHKTIKLVAEDDNPIDLRFIDNGAEYDLFLMFGNVTQEELYDLIDRKMKMGKKHCNIFTYFFRGKLGNPGIPSEKSITKDIKAIGEFLNKRNKKMCGLGFSFGCGIILRLANLAKFDTIILANPFASLRDAVRSFSIYRPVSFILIDTWDNIGHIKKLKDTKIQIYTSQNDSIIPPKQSEVLKQNNDNAKQEILPNIDHNNIFDDKILDKILFSFEGIPSSN